MGESGIQTLLKKHIANWPTEIELGFRASLPMLEVKLQAQNKSDYPALEQCLAQVKGLLGDHIVTEDHRVISAVVKDLLIEKQQTITFAESCTGGLIAANLTEIAGASAVFEAGFVTYSNAMKQALVNVSDASLRQHGAVSEPVVREMLSGALVKTNANIGVAVSGVAGPSGGSNEKPVGTVWIAWGTATHAKAHCFYFPVDRKRFQILVAAVAFDLVRRELLGINEQAIYFKERTFKPRH
jgi:nicotinamide-nucleotide amidase